MRTSAECREGDKLIHIISNEIYTVGYACGDSIVLIDDDGISAIYPTSLIRGWFRMYKEYTRH